MATPDHEALAAALLGTVLSVGRHVLDARARGLAVTEKADRSPVTAADEMAEAMLSEAIGTAFPGVPVIGEEAVARGLAPAAGATFFLLDPIDGTRGFIRGSDAFTINVGLVRDGAAHFGLVYAPARAQLFVTLGPDHAAEASLPPTTEPLRLADVAWQHIRTRPPDAANLTALASHAHNPVLTDALLKRLGVASTRRVNSSLKFGLMARGECDLYARVGGINEWDTAAGHALVLAAGGWVADFAGGAVTYGHRDRGFRTPSFIAWSDRGLAERLAPKVASFAVEHAASL